MTFTGVSQYDIPGEIAADVSPIVTMISPIATPFLDFIGSDAVLPIFNKSYSWEQKYMLPETFTMSSAIASSAAASGIEVGANASLIRVGDILRNKNNGEQMFVTSIATNAATIYITRAYAGTTATSLAAGQVLEFLGSAIEEGSSPRLQRRRGKTNVVNFVQTFREDVSISRLADNATMLWQLNKSGGSNLNVSPYLEEITDKTRECLIQLERAVLMGRTNGNTIGADDAPSTMAGIYNSIPSTNIVSHATYSNSIVNNAIAAINNYTEVRENSDKYFLLCGDTAHRRITNAREARIQQQMDSASAGLAAVRSFDTDYGPMPVLYSRRIPTGSILVLRKDYIKVRPFVNNSFMQKKYENGVDAEQGYVTGTYGLEFNQFEAHARIDGIS